MVAKPLCPLYKYIIKPLDRAYYPELRYWIAFVQTYRKWVNLLKCDTNWFMQKV